MTDPWDDDLIQMLREELPPPEPTAAEAAAYVGMKVAEYGAYLLLALSGVLLWVVLP